VVPLRAGPSQATARGACWCTGVPMPSCRAPAASGCRVSDSPDHPHAPRNAQRARSEYAGLLGTIERKASWRARFDGLKVRNRIRTPDPEVLGSPTFAGTRESTPGYLRGAFRGAVYAGLRPRFRMPGGWKTAIMQLLIREIVDRTGYPSGMRTATACRIPPPWDPFPPPGPRNALPSHHRFASNSR
jgi:hypothetical protein